MIGRGGKGNSRRKEKNDFHYIKYLYKKKLNKTLLLLLQKRHIEKLLEKKEVREFLVE